MIMKTIIRYSLATLAFLFVWAAFPNRWLLSMGLDAAWVGLFQLLTVFGAVLLIAGKKQSERTRKDEEMR